MKKALEVVRDKAGMASGIFELMVDDIESGRVDKCNESEAAGFARALWGVGLISPMELHEAIKALEEARNEGREKRAKEKA